MDSMLLCGGLAVACLAVACAGSPVWREAGGVLGLSVLLVLDAPGAATVSESGRCAPRGVGG
eukprot:2340748-Heterocapsa_arctica.AAC.1